MIREIYPSSYLCDCGYQADFFERTVASLKQLSRQKRRRVRLGCDDDKHVVVFADGEAVDVLCPGRVDSSAAGADA